MSEAVTSSWYACVSLLLLLLLEKHFRQFLLCVPAGVIFLFQGVPCHGWPVAFSFGHFREQQIGEPRTVQFYRRLKRRYAIQRRRRIGHAKDVTPDSKGNMLNN